MRRWSEIGLGVALATMLVMVVGCTKPQATKSAENTSGPESEKIPTVEQASKAAAQGTLVFTETFDDENWREDWSGSTTAWRVEGGKLKGQGDKNAGLWWSGELPKEAIIEFDAWAESKDGDLKVELYGTKREHQSGYVVILGGWKNRISIIARKDEHGGDRLENRQKVASPGQKHHFRIVKQAGDLSWYVDGQQVLSFADKAPLSGTTFGFANWEAPVAFDDLRIFDLTEVTRN